jgi:hypothetical protein
MSNRQRTKFWNEIASGFPQDFWQTQPVKVDNRDGRNNIRYSFSRVHFDRAHDLEVDIGKVDTWFFDDLPEDSTGVTKMLVWKYGEKDPVFITQDGVYVREGTGKEMAYRQAYYALNYLDGEAMVSGWTK